jgi:hypothetical protein
MGTVHYPSGIDENRPRRSDDARPDLELPGWEAFTAARDRFFAGLQSAAELYRTGQPEQGSPDEKGDDSTQARPPL